MACTLLVCQVDVLVYIYMYVCDIWTFIYTEAKVIRLFYLPTVRSFCELTRYLLGFEMAKTPYLLSEHFSQDPIENYFGQQRSQGGWSQNPTVQACLTSAQSLRVQGSLAMMPLRGNSRRKKRLFKDKEEVIDDKPLPKRPRKK